MIREHVAIEEKEYIYSIDKICCYVNDDNRAYLQIVGWQKQKFAGLYK